MRKLESIPRPVDTPASDPTRAPESFTFAQAAKIVSLRLGGRKVHVSTLHRWCTLGLRGIKLRFVQIGGTRCTSIEYLDDFFARLTAARTGETDSALHVRSSSACRRAAERDDRELARILK